MSGIFSQNMGDPSYSLSGKTHFSSFIPAAAVSLVYAYAMGTALGWVALTHCAFLVMAGLLAVPVAGAVVAAIWWGRCRSRGLALGLSVVAALLYCGTACVAFIAESGTGACPVDWLYSLAAVVVVVCLVPAYAMTRRVYFEASGVWAHRHQLFFSPANMDAVVAAVRLEDWGRLRTLQPVVGKASSVLLRLEYARGRAMEPVFVSVAVRRGSPDVSWLAGAVGFPRRDIVRQKQIDADSAARLACALDLPLGQLRVVDSPAKRMPSVLPLLIPAAGQSRCDLLAEPAVACVSRLSRNGRASNLGSLSFCLPVAEAIRTGGVPLAGVSAWLVCGFVAGVLALGGLGLLLGKLAGWGGWACGSVLLGGLAFSAVCAPMSAWMSSYCRAWKWRRRFRRRSESLLTSDAWDAGWDLNISVTQPRRVAGDAPDDFGFCEFDWANQRLLIEGLRYRYLIRAEDVLGLAPACHSETLAVELTCQMAGAVPLRLVLSRRHGERGFSHLPVWGWLYPHRDGGWWLWRFSQTLSVPAR